jgi:hypothetical protein
MPRGGQESGARDLRKSAILFGFEVSWAPDYRGFAVPLRFLVIFAYGRLIP